MKRRIHPHQQFYDLVWPHRSAVLRSAMFLTRHGAQAEDLAQETLLRAFRSLEQFEHGSNVKAWLMRILRNLWIDRLRAERSHEHDARLGDIDVAAPECEAASGQQDWTNPHAMMQSFSDAQVIEALKALPEEIRWTLLLVDIEQLDQSDAATILGIPVGTVKSRAHRGRAMLREKLLPLAREMRLVDR